MIKEPVRSKHAITHFLFEECARRYPQQIATSAEGQSLTYDALNRKANQLAHYLLTHELPPETLIGISMPRSVDLLIGVLAILKAGYAFLPIDETHPAERQSFILNDAKTPILITQSALQQTFSHFQGKKIFLDIIWQKIQSCPAHNPFTHAMDKHLAYVIYTSGSTGKSKGVLIEHHGLVNYIRWVSDYLGCRSQDRIDFSANFAFDMAVTSSVVALALGLTIIICPETIKKNIKDYLLYLQKNRINIIKISPSYFKLMVEEMRHDYFPLPALKTIILGGESLPVADCKIWLNLFPRHQMINEYGPTETTVGVTQFKLTKYNVDQYQKFVPIGKPGKHIQCQLIDNELYVSGPCVARGYLHQPELTDKQFVMLNDMRWYRTGDMCEYLPDGNLSFVGRKDDQIKIRGFKVEPREIETSLLAHDNIKDVVVAARKTKSNDQRLVAWYQLKDKALPLTQAALRVFLRARLAEYMIPTNFVMLDTFPLTENGKLDKTALPEPVINEEKALRAHTKSEKALQYIWRKAFHLEKIGLNTDFFELGGNSLMAARIISNIEKYMNKKLNVDDVYNAPTIQELALRVNAAPSLKKEKARESFSFAKSKSIPLSDFQLIFWISRLFAPQIRDLNMIASRRLSGNLDAQKLEFAFDELIKRHEVLRYRQGTFYPGQYLESQGHFRIAEQDLQNHSSAEQEKMLSDSLHQLLHEQTWQKGKPLVKAKLFHLHDGVSELQIAASHMVFDDASQDILFSELSRLYLKEKVLPYFI